MTHKCRCGNMINNPAQDFCAGCNAERIIMKEIERMTTDQTSDALTDEEILQSALIKGFSLSTAYGQECGQLMPISDSATLIAFARDIERMTRADQPGWQPIETAPRDGTQFLANFDEYAIADAMLAEREKAGK